VNNKPPALKLYLVFALAFLGLAGTAVLRAQSLHSLSLRSNLQPPKRSHPAAPQVTPSWMVPDVTDRQKPGRSVTWSGYSLTPHPSVQPTPTKGPTVKTSGLKNKKTPIPELKGKWYSLLNTPTPLPFSSKIKPLQLLKDSTANKGLPVKASKFSAWNMKFMKNQSSIYQGKNGGAASILMNFTPVVPPDNSQ
jgi:hypothetical protein